MAECAGKSIRQPVAVIVNSFAEEVAGLAEETAKRTMSKLQGVMVSPRPTGVEEKCKEGSSPREYPEYFALLAAKIQSIKNSLNTINDGLDRTEF